METGRLQLIFIFTILIFLVSCSLPPDKAGSQGADNKPPETSLYKTSTAKTILISETHPVGESLSHIEINTRGFEHNFAEVFKDTDPIANILLADLDHNGFDEIYIITTSAGSGSYGSVLGFASNRDKSLSMINFPKIEAEDNTFQGYRGHDSFTIEDRKLIRTFPVYKEGDTNQHPTGGTRKLVYGLYPGEAMWQLKIESTETKE